MNVAFLGGMRVSSVFTVGVVAAQLCGCGGDSTAGGVAVGGCGVHDSFGSKLAVNTLGSEGGVYSGPAVVERSTADSLILYFESAPDGDAGAPIVRRATFSGLTEMPVLPVGGKVWLSKDPAGDTPFVPPYMRPPGWAFSIRDRDQGRLLLGAANDSNSSAAPITFGERADGCVVHNPICSGQEAQVFYQTVEVHGDSTVSIGDSETATVRLDGIDYDVRVTARRETSGSQGCYADYYASNAGGVSIDLQATDLSLLLDGIERGEPPACGHGNSRSVEAYFELYNKGSRDGYDGPVVYHGVDSDSWQRAWRFDLPGPIEPGFDAPPMLLVYVTPGTLREPGVNQSLWLSFPSRALQVLREVEDGPLLLASASYLSTPFDAATAALLEQELGVSVAAEESCEYMAGDETHRPLALWDPVFGTTPPVRVKSGELGQLTLGGRDYAVWAWGEDSIQFALYAL